MPQLRRSRPLCPHLPEPTPPTSTGRHLPRPLGLPDPHVRPAALPQAAPRAPAPPLPRHPAPARPGHQLDDAYFIPALPISPIYSIAELDVATAIADIGTPGDIVCDTWLRRHPQLMTGPIRPATITYALGHDVPASIGHFIMRLLTRAADGAALSLDLPNVHTLRHDSVPLLVDLYSHRRLRLVVDAAISILYTGPSRTPIRCLIRRGHLVLPPLSPTAASTTYYTRTEMGLAHRQFGHAGVEAIVRAFPRGTFFSEDITHVQSITDTCVPCQQHAHLLRRPRHALPNPPHVFNRVITMDAFQLSPSLPKVLDVTDLHTDWGQGRFVPTMRGEIFFSILYLTWFAICGPPETVRMDRGFENENDALIHALHSMLIHWRSARTEAPWSVGHNERHHGPIRDAFLRIVAETPALAPDLALAIAYKARNDAPRARDVAPTTSVTGDLPRLIIGDNHHADPTLAARASAMQTAQATM